MLRQLQHSHLSLLTMNWLVAHAVRHSTDDKSSQSDIARCFKEPPTLSRFALPGITILLGSCRSSSRSCFAFHRAVAHSSALLPIPPRRCSFHHSFLRAFLDPLAGLLRFILSPSSFFAAVFLPFPSSRISLALLRLFSLASPLFFFLLSPPSCKIHKF